MTPSSNGKDTRFSFLQYGFNSRWCLQLSGCRLSLVEGSAWNGEVIGSNPITLTSGSFVQWFSISDCLSEDRGSIPLWTAMKVDIKM